MRMVPVSKPALGVRELISATRTLSGGHISGLSGNQISAFESMFADFIGSQYAVSCSSGTAALHLSLVALGIGPGDEVLVSDTTNMASFFAVLYTGAKPVPVDILPNSMTIDPRDLAAKITPRSRAVMPVHLFGQPSDMAEILRIAKLAKLHVVEDCAEAHGAQFGNKKVGSFGIAGCFSFFANKILTTGEGGIVTTNDAGLANELRALRSLNFGEGSDRFFHRGIGFNYRMTNLQAAIGIAQLKRIDRLIESRRDVENSYRQNLSSAEEISWQSGVSEFATPVTWMSHIILPTKEIRRRLISGLSAQGVDTRPGFVPFSLQNQSWAGNAETRHKNPVSGQLAFTTMYLPTWSGMPLSLTRKISSRVARILQSIRSTAS